MMIGRLFALPKPPRGGERRGRMGTEGRERVSNPLSSHETKTDSFGMAKDPRDPQDGPEGVSETVSGPRQPTDPQTPELTGRKQRSRSAGQQHLPTSS